MGQTILYTAVSIDGYIADSSGNIDFLDHPQFQIPEEDYGYNNFLESVDTIIMGYRTYVQIINFEGEFPYKGKHTIVLSRDENITVVDEEIEVFTDSSIDLLKDLKKKGKKIWIVGGGATNARFHSAALIDEMILTFIPTTLGTGVPLFRDNDNKLHWTTKNVKSYPNGLVQVHFAKASST